MSMATIVHPWRQKVLPLTYEESLSYDEEICKLIHKINEMINLFNEWEAVINELQQAIIDLPTIKEDLASLKVEVTTMKNLLELYGSRLEDVEKGVAENSTDIVELREKVDSIIFTVNNTLDTFMATVDAKINQVTYQLDEDIHLLAYKVNQLKVSVYAEIALLKARMDKIDTSAINPWWQNLGRLTPDENMKKIYYDLADNVPTAEEYCKLGYTADEYREFLLRARKYARFGKQKLNFFWVYSPVYGWRQELNNVLTSIVNECKGTMTAEQYTGGAMTAEDYSRLNLSAYDYYSFSVERLGVYESNGVLQSEQYVLTENDGVLEVYGADFVETNGVLETTP